LRSSRPPIPARVHSRVRARDLFRRLRFRFIVAPVLLRTAYLFATFYNIYALIPANWLDSLQGIWWELLTTSTGHMDDTSWFWLLTRYSAESCQTDRDGFKHWLRSTAFLVLPLEASAFLNTGCTTAPPGMCSSPFSRRRNCCITTTTVSSGRFAIPTPATHSD